MEMVSVAREKFDALIAAYVMDNDCPECIAKDTCTESEPVPMFDAEDGYPKCRAALKAYFGLDQGETNV